jgi:hypothetical protein
MLNVICLKHGTKYGADYVNKLQNMIQRHLTVPYRFVCFTDNPQYIDPRVEIRLLPTDLALQGWWWKLYLFKEGLFDADDINLFIDLDMVVVSSLDKFVNYMPGEFLGLENLNRAFKRYPATLGSAMMRWPANSYTNIWTEFEKNPKAAMKCQGDQDWVWLLHSKTIKFFPRDWIISYKWEARTIKDHNRVRGRTQFKNIANPTIPSETSVLAFHGSPDPHEVMDPIIVDNWR